MRYLSVSSVLLLLVMFVTGCSEEAAPTAALLDSIENPAEALSKNGVIHHVSVGGADVCEALGAPTGCDANFSLVANQKANGSVSGQWQDTFRGLGGIHVAIDCLNVVGNEAWVSGVVTHGSIGDRDLTGLPAITRVVDNGTSANDTPDQLSFSFTDPANFSDNCNDAPDLPLFDLTHGQVKVK